MCSTTTLPVALAEFDSVLPAEIAGSLFRMTVDQYERLVQTGLLDGQAIELINGLLVQKSWIVNLIDRKLEIHTGPTAVGYQDRLVLATGEEAPLVLDGKEVGRIQVSAIMPPVEPTNGR